MTKDAITQRTTFLDSAHIAEIARKVIAHLAETDASGNSSTKATGTEATATAIDAQVITAQIIEQVPGAPTQAFILPSAVITPAARDTARQRGLELQRTVALPAEQRPNHSQFEITDYAQPERADAIRQQLARRGITGGAANIVLSDTPAKEVYFQCAKHHEVAVMIASISDIQRFAEEVSPTLWVLDMQRLNFSAAVNSAAQIIQTKKAAR